MLLLLPLIMTKSAATSGRQPDFKLSKTVHIACVQQKKNKNAILYIQQQNNRMRVRCVYCKACMVGDRNVVYVEKWPPPKNVPFTHKSFVFQCKITYNNTLL